MSELPNPVQQLLKRAAETPNAPYLHQPVKGVWRTWTWAEVAEQAQRMAAALVAMNLPKGSAVAMTGMNNAHWFMADFACGIAGLIGVGLYPKQSEDAVRFISEHAGIKVAFIGPMPDVAGFIKALPADVVKISLPYPGVAAYDHHWDELVAKHAPLPKPVERGPDDIWSLIYTSGTTGNPKGVIITAKNLTFTVAGMLRDQPAIASGEHFMSYLPLAHAFERGAVETASLYLPAQVHFLEELEKLPETLAAVRPTRFYGVPLVYTRIQAGILKKLPQAKIDRLLGIPIVSGLVKKKIRKGLGLDRSWLRVSGAAPLPKPVMDWFGKLGIELFQGYGMTENSIYASLNLPGKNKVGSIGKPFVDSGIRIAEDGEIQCKHPGNTPGYYKDPEKTAELFTADGWLRTGDKGHIDADGYLFITGRVKEIFKTLKGKYVSPAPVEGKFGINTHVEQMCLVGAGLFQPMLVLSLNADARKLPKAELEAGLVSTMKAVNETLEPHEEIAKIVVTKDTWTIDNGLMTPTMKVRRNEIEKRYGELLAKLEADRKLQVYWEG
ncbi:AMP-binding protein [Nevskia sp.]|uniref:AMP-binding protein n=1 Tax=Nevskia sp. TaxID=1929292 RepID=UPI0025DE268B|nr:AMP-binding protein [Nevskia sp.]HET7796974.1 AMP-binding protein [Nevskia sp.]